MLVPVKYKMAFNKDENCEMWIEAGNNIFLNVLLSQFLKVYK